MRFTAPIIFDPEFAAANERELLSVSFSRIRKQYFSCRCTDWRIHSRNSRQSLMGFISSKWTGLLTVGLLIGFLLYINSFYEGPLRTILPPVWSSFQDGCSRELDRITEVLALETDMPVIEAPVENFGDTARISACAFSVSRWQRGFA